MAEEDDKGYRWETEYEKTWYTFAMLIINAMMIFIKNNYLQLFAAFPDETVSDIAGFS